eukprot:CAMPEP_0172321700 /NCGR_PEP_ID=MMETSP1058-20130122/44069_1 /TAXON_ID=83371 /ORGANISM="Detonula confervacea, Strain CCMP 353" /LENGTH=206 /DNA_ID=CAMNT_0013037281 /DNA_START=211 /DNA_END=831 /DNA_ORIENTATION=-
MPKRVAEGTFKSDVKEKAQKESDKAEMIAITESLLGVILSHPNSWNEPSLNNIKSMIAKLEMTVSPTPHPLGEHDNSSDDHSPPAHPNLSENIGKSLYKRESIDFSNVTLQITAAAPENTTTKLDGELVSVQHEHILYRLWKLNAIDANKTVITVRLDITLNSEGKLLTDSAVIFVTSAFALYMNYGDMYDMRCAIVGGKGVCICE